LEGTFGGVFRIDWEKIHVELAGRERKGFISKGRTMTREGCFLVEAPVIVWFISKELVIVGVIGF
jgi:hypothetical protein